MTEARYRLLSAGQEQGTLVLTILAAQIEGEEIAEALRQEMLQAVGPKAHPRVVIDWRNVKFISSAAFRPLLGLRRKLNENGGKMVLCGLSPAVGDVFYTTRMVSGSGSFAAPFDLEQDVAAAIARLQGPAEPPEGARQTGTP